MYEDTNIDHRKNIISEYKPEVEKLIRYLPWMIQKQGQKTMNNFQGNGITESSITFPVYDSTLMGFIKTAQKTKFMDKNYIYVYNRLRIRTVKDELAAIDDATIRDMDVLRGILSRYVLGGMTKGILWSEGVENGIYIQLLTKMKQLVEITELE